MSVHRGRWQAQGGGLDESEPWNRLAPLPARDGLILLARLEQALGPAERAYRADSFAKAMAFVERARRAGGLDATYIRSFPAPGDRHGRRVDVEVRAGRAFVP